MMVQQTEMIHVEQRQLRSFSSWRSHRNTATTFINANHRYKIIIELCIKAQKSQGNVTSLSCWSCSQWRSHLLFTNEGQRTSSQIKVDAISLQWRSRRGRRARVAITCDALTWRSHTKVAKKSRALLLYLLDDRVHDTQELGPRLLDERRGQWTGPDI